MQDLGTLQGDVNSGGIGINDRGQVVGVSFDASFNMRAFLWQNGVMTDLSTLIPANSSLYPLLFAHGINSRGEIVGFALQTSTGDIHAFLTTPCNQDDADSECGRDDGAGAAAKANETTEGPRPVFSKNARKLLQQQLHLGRFGAPLMGLC
jgi:probable HAF family extracellular repeat protein